MRQPPVQKPVQPDAVLGAIVGTEPILRSLLTSKLWVYIREHATMAGRNIQADAKLKALFDGADVINMFELQKYVSLHLVKGNA